MRKAASAQADFEIIQCNQCQAGMMRPHRITYFTWLDNELVMVPNFPAGVCDVCGRREYDERSVAWLRMFLSPNMGQTTIHSKPRHPLRGGKKHHQRPNSSE